jgi:hypothetical protein
MTRKGKHKMPTLAAQITIGDYAKWRPVFDKNKHLRGKAGLVNVRVYRDADNPKELNYLEQNLGRGESARSFEQLRD